MCKISKLYSKRFKSWRGGGFHPPPCSHHPFFHHAGIGLRYLQYLSGFNRTSTKNHEFRDFRQFSVGLTAKNTFLRISTCGFRLISILDLLHASAKKFFRKIYSKGVPGDPKILKKKFFRFFFESCSESSETHFGIKISHLKIFHSDPPRGPPGGSKNLKKYFFENMDPYHYPVQI